MFRIKLAAIVVGAIVAFMGYQEFKLSGHAKEEATTVLLEELEANGELENAHIRIDEPVGVYGGLIYEYRQSKYDTGEPDESTSVAVAYYPIISQAHPFMAKLGELLIKYPDGIPDDVSWPEMDNFRVLVKTKRFNTIGDFPYDALLSDPSVQGLVVNEIESLDNEEIGLLKESFPKADFSQVLILEEGRKPSSSGKYLGMMGGGAALALVGLFSLVGGKRKA